MQDTFKNVASMLNNIMFLPNLGGAELLVTLLMAGGFLMIGISALLPKDKASDLEWWER